MSPALKAFLLSLASFVGATTLTYVASHLSTSGLPSEYIPVIGGLIAVVMHWIPSPANQLSTGAQK